MSLEQKLEQLHEQARATVAYPDPAMLGKLAGNDIEKRDLIAQHLNVILANALFLCKEGSLDEDTVVTFMTKGLDNLNVSFPGCHVHNMRLNEQVSMFFGVNYDVA
jgi:hypothetical protein